jgi:cellulose synthase/poly-beta-1,6-N-acetylglucosamine synthase-like glycosyltransferase
MLVLILSCIILLVLYAALIGGYWLNWEKYPEYVPEEGKNKPGFSVIIPFRNEQHHLPFLLNALVLQEYPLDKMEVILVNDHSHDQSVKIIRDFCIKHSHFKLIHLQPREYGKKIAINAGIQASKRELIVTTDADGRPGKKWLSCLASYYADFSPAMIIGLVSPETNSDIRLGYFQQLELISLVGSGAASAMGGKPIYCSGANLCYPKDSYHRFKDPLLRSVASGEDTFFMLQLKKHCRNKIHVLKSKDAVIHTKTEGTLTGFMKQRSRWISKSTHYRDREIVYSALVVLLTNLALVLTAILTACGRQPWLFVVMLLIKLFIDGLFLQSLAKFFGIKFRYIYYVISGLIYPFYLFLTVLRAFVFPNDWKGRQLISHL